MAPVSRQDQVQPAQMEGRLLGPEAGWCSVTSPGLGVDQPLVQVSTRNLCVPDQVTFLSKPVTRGRGERRLPASRQVSFPPSRAEAPSCVSHWTGAEPEGAGGHTPKCMD